MKSVLRTLAGVALALVVAVTVGCSSSAAQNGGGDANPVDPVPVKIIKAERVDMSRTIRQPATVHADQQAHIYAKVAGYLGEVKADIGQPVKENEALATISIPEMKQRWARLSANIARLKAEEKRAAAEIAVAKATKEKAGANVKKVQADLTAATSEEKRVSSLVSRRSVAESLLDEAQQKLNASKAEKEAAEKEVLLAEANVTLATENGNAAKEMTNVAVAELAECEEMIKYATLRSPFKGVVAARNVDQGDLVRNSESSGKDGPPLYVVAKTDPVRIRVPVPERDAMLIQVGQEAHIALQAMAGQPLLIDGKPPKVTRKAGALDESTRTMLVEIDVPNPDGRLLPGMFGEATIVAEADKSRLMLPAGVVRFDEQGKSYVFVVSDDDEIDVVDVTTGLDTGSQIEITKGLSGDERIVAPMIRRLKAGQKVRVE